MGALNSLCFDCDDVINLDSNAMYLFYISYPKTYGHFNLDIVQNVNIN